MKRRRRSGQEAQPAAIEIPRRKEATINNQARRFTPAGFLRLKEAAN
jgi:hypothetical protein